MGFLTNKIFNIRKQETPEKRSTLANPSQYLQDWFNGVFFGLNSAGILVNEETAMHCSIFAACVNAIADTISGLPLDLFMKKPNGSREKASDTNLVQKLLDRPNPYMPPTVFWKLMVKNYLVAGGAYAEIVEAGENIYLYPLAPKNVKICVNGGITYEVRVNGDFRILREDQVFKILYNSDDGINPISTVARHSEAIGLAIAAERFGSKFFGSGANLSGIISHPGNLDPAGEAIKTLRESLEQVYSGLENSHKTMVLEEGMKYQQLGIDPEKGQFLQTRQFQSQEIARIFSIPLDRVSVSYGNNSTYSNAEHRDLEFLKYTIKPICTNIQAAISHYLLGGNNSRYAEFNYNSLLQVDTKTRAEFYKILHDLGIINANFILAKENQPSQGEPGDVYYIGTDKAPK